MAIYKSRDFYGLTDGQQSRRGKRQGGDEHRVAATGCTVEYREKLAE